MNHTRASKLNPGRREPRSEESTTKGPAHRWGNNPSARYRAKSGARRGQAGPAKRSEVFSCGFLAGPQAPCAATNNNLDSRASRKVTRILNFPAATFVAV